MMARLSDLSGINEDEDNEKKSNEKISSYHAPFNKIGGVLSNLTVQS